MYSEIEPKPCRYKVHFLTTQPHICLVVVVLEMVMVVVMAIVDSGFNECVISGNVFNITSSNTIAHGVCRPSSQSWSSINGSSGMYGSGMYGRSSCNISGDGSGV